MNAKIAKFATKAGVSLGFAALIGYAIKLEHKVDDKIDEHYDKSETEETSDV